MVTILIRLINFLRRVLMCASYQLLHQRALVRVKCSAVHLSLLSILPMKWFKPHPPSIYLPKDMR